MKMTGKQALYDLIDEIKYTHSDGVSLTPFDKKRTDAIIKDLEILEILKKYLKNKSLDLGIEDIVICCENEEDYNKIKEWLNEED